MNPPFPLPVLIPLLAVGLLLGLVLSWGSTSGLRPGHRWLLLLLRGTALCGLAALLLNLGRWVKPHDTTPRPWIILTDISASMGRSSSNSSSPSSRYTIAKELAEKTARSARDAGLAVRLQTFADGLHPAMESLPGKAEGKGSEILRSVESLFQESSAAGESPAGIILLSDGRQTGTSATGAMEALSLRARARETPVHTIAVGAGEPVADLTLRAARPVIHVFAGQAVRVPVVVDAKGLGSLRPTLVLSDATGKELSRQTMDLSDGKPASATFDLPCPAESTRWTIGTAVQEGETRPGNNSATVSIRVLTSKTRVFLAEGAPYWDSKFLAQLMRQQKHMDVHSVHRLSDERYFRIDSGDAAPAETSKAIFPETLEELSRYDLVIFGKNVDAFLTPSRLEALRAYVRDQGGAVLFARGKPATAEVPGLEPLEPVTWSNTTTPDFRFTPNAEGEAAGLFGESLPAASASVWNSLPTLKDGRAVLSVKPFTRILAEGVPSGTSGGKFPALLVRRYGQGVTGLANGDGLWKWDFYPEARELGNMYEDFWTQLTQWMATYSEFLPGQDFSLHLSSSQGETGRPVTLSISYRGNMPAPSPVLKVSMEGTAPVDLVPASVPDPSGRPRWQATFTPSGAGTWQIKLVDPRPQAPATPEVELIVPRPADEQDDLSPDPAFLASLAEATGGKTVMPGDFDEFLKGTLHITPPVTLESGAVWQPAWNEAWVALGLAFFPATEWFLRRRQGLS